jgi:hypothetical protein
VQEFLKISQQFIPIQRKLLTPKLLEIKGKYGRKMTDIRRYLKALFGIWWS